MNVRVSNLLTKHPHPSRNFRRAACCVIFAYRKPSAVVLPALRWLDDPR